MGCISEKECTGCGKKIVCDSSGKANKNEPESSIHYVWGPCICGMYECPCCKGVLKGGEWRVESLLQIGNESVRFAAISPVQALKDIVSSTEQMLKDGEINLENYQKIVESAVQGIKEIGLKDA